MLPGPDTRRLELWRLALEARSIPHLIVGHGAGQRVFVPPVWEGIARSELHALKVEATASGRYGLPPGIPNAHWAVFAFLVLIFWHGLSMGWWPLPVEHLPEPDFWFSRGRLDVYRVLLLGEWWRSATALTLHGDGLHLFSNVLFGSLFFILLSRRMGFGLALALGVLSGMMGNLLNAVYQPYTHTSVGFSTALFGMVGLLSADFAMRERHLSFKFRFFLPLAAAMGLLALLGMHGERTDYAAHVFGVVAGYGLGLGASAIVRTYGRPPVVAEAVIGLSVPVFLLWCWYLAFN